MISIHDLDVGDVFKREKEIWIVESWCAEPTVTMRRVWPPESADAFGVVRTQRGGISGLMWEGFNKMGHET